MKWRLLRIVMIYVYTVGIAGLFMLCLRFRLYRICLCMIRKMCKITADDSTPQQQPDSTPQRPPSEELQTVRVRAPRESAGPPPSQVPPSAPRQVQRLQDERIRLVKECLFRRKLEDGATVAEIQSILLAAARDLPSLPAESCSTPEEPPPSTPECSICLQCYQAGETVCWSKTNDCNHIFHSECIQQWIQNGHDHCPLCRTDFMSFHPVQ